MNTKTLALVGVVAVVAIAAIAIGLGSLGNNNQDEVTDGVNYYGNGGTTSDGKSVVGSTSHDVSPNFFNKEGAYFNYWNTKSDGTGTTYYPGDKIDYKDGTSVRLYAIWYTGGYLNYFSVMGTGSFTVSYDGKALSSVEGIKIPSSGKITLTVTPNTAEGKLVVINDNELEQRIINGDKVTYSDVTFSLTGDATCSMTTDGATGYYTITYNGSGTLNLNASGSTPSTHAKGVNYVNPGESGYKAIDSSTVADNMFTATGKTFVSWNTARDGSGTTYMPGDTIDYYGYVILYAQWA